MHLHCVASARQRQHKQAAPCANRHNQCREQAFISHPTSDCDENPKPLGFPSWEIVRALSHLLLLESVDLHCFMSCRRQAPTGRHANPTLVGGSDDEVV